MPVRLAKLLLIAFFLFAFQCIVPVCASALEVYTLMKNGCERETGLIINTDEENVHMLNMDGKLVVQKRKEIDIILVYHVHDNPIKYLDLGSGLKDSLREVQVDDNENTHFIGWPIRFIENLIMFYDIDGKTHLVSLDKIKAFSHPDVTNFATEEISNAKPVKFGLGDNLPECKSIDPDENKYIEPTRMISDQIRVQKFFSVYHAGFTLLNRFQKKTAFYAKPFLYDKETRLGLVYTKYGHEMILPSFMNIQWSNGTPYGSQGQYALGSKPVDLLPLVEPQFVFKADAKSHLFTGSFAGNLMSLSGGSDYVVENRQLFTDFFSNIDTDAHAVYKQFNYLALTGVEYHKYSISYGFYYPIYGVLGNGIFREITSNNPSAVLRLMRTTSDLSLKLIYSNSHLHSNSPNDSGINLILANELSEYAIKSDESNQLISSLTMYDLKTKFVRININYDITDEVNIGFSEVYFDGKYSEIYAGASYALDFSHFISSLSIKQNFSDYTALKGDINYFIEKNKFKLANETGDSNDVNLSFTISVEFFL